MHGRPDSRRWTRSNGTGLTLAEGSTTPRSADSPCEAAAHGRRGTRCLASIRCSLQGGYDGLMTVAPVVSAKDADVSKVKNTMVTVGEIVDPQLRTVATTVAS